MLGKIVMHNHVVAQDGRTCRASAAHQRGPTRAMNRVYIPVSCSWTSLQQPRAGTARDVTCSFGGNHAWTRVFKSSKQLQRTSIICPATFDNLSKGIERAWNMVKKDGKLTPDNIKEPIKEIRRALLEADVSLPVVRRFVKQIEQKALGVQVLQGVTPDVQFVKVVNDQLVELMGGGGMKELNPARDDGRPQVIVMAGLQGVGKTTACGKLALYLKKRGKKVLMVATDIYRPAAIDQLQKLGESLEVPVFELGNAVSPVEIAKQGVEEGMKLGVDAIIIDTAGRLQINDDLMSELKSVKDSTNPTDTLLVVDAMTGQEAANLTKAFNDLVELTGAILTKTDGDSRGGAALTVREVSGKPIKFVGVGETMDALEPFYPERMASRILGMGDMLTLYEKAQSSIKEEDAALLAKRMMESKFDFNDFLRTYKSVSGMGNMSQIMKMLPGMNKVSEKQLYEVEKKFKMYEDMIDAMTDEERADPDLLVKSTLRRKRVAEGSSHSVGAVAGMLAEFTKMRVQMKSMSKMMKMGAASGKLDDEAMMKELLETTQKQVASGKVRRKKDKDTRQLVTTNKTGKGFGAQK